MSAPPRRRDRPHARAARYAGITGFGWRSQRSAANLPPAVGTLTVRYIRPTPLHTDLVFEGKTASVEGRKIFVIGTLHAADILTAEAEGVFVNLLQPRAAEYFEDPSS